MERTYPYLPSFPSSPPALLLVHVFDSFDSSPSLTRQEGEKKANYWGSICMASTARLGNDARGNAVHVPLRNLLPTVHPNDLVLGGWDICSDDLATAMSKAAVLVRRLGVEGTELVWLDSCDCYEGFWISTLGATVCKKWRIQYNSTRRKKGAWAQA